MTICIFPGTFNPIHNGHIKMAEYALDKYNFDKIIFVPSYLPPHKDIDSKLAEHRFNMVKIAIEKNSGFGVSDIEYLSDGKSYSVITVKKIIEQYKLKERLNFIIGTDAFDNVENWYEANELKKLVHFIVFPRRGISVSEKDGWDYEVTDMEFADISSTEIRDGKKIETDEKVEVYIKKHGLYKI